MKWEQAGKNRFLEDSFERGQQKRESREEHRKWSLAERWLNFLRTEMLKIHF